jgi:hypothetical protein
MEQIWPSTSLTAEDTELFPPEFARFVRAREWRKADFYRRAPALVRNSGRAQEDRFNTVRRSSELVPEVKGVLSAPGSWLGKEETVEADAHLR